MWLASLWCRLFGKSCSVVRPASRDIIAEMQEHSRKAEAETDRDPGRARRVHRGRVLSAQGNKEHNRNAH